MYWYIEGANVTDITPVDNGGAAKITGIPARIEVEPGENFTFNLTIFNPTNDNIVLNKYKFFLTVDTDPYTGNDKGNNTWCNNADFQNINLGAGQSINKTVKCSVPKGQTEGTYYLRIGSAPIPLIILPTQFCSSLGQGQTCNLSWIVNATGDVGTVWKVGVLFNSSLPEVKNNNTENMTVKIIENIPPKYSLSSINSTISGTKVSHSLYWHDNTGLSYAIFSFDNCTGSFQNISGVSLSGVSTWSNFTVGINSTAGCTIRWCIYANDTFNNWNRTSCENPFSYNTSGIKHLTLFLSPQIVWWNESVLAFGKLYKDSTPLQNKNVDVKLENKTKCSGLTNLSGEWSCSFYAPFELGVYTITAEAEGVTASANLEVKASYGETPIGTIERIVYELPLLIQDLSGKIRRVFARIIIWK